MSIQSEINRISGNVANALTAIASKGVTVPQGSNSDDLATLIAQISGGGTGAISIVDTPDAAGGTVRTITAVDISDTTAVAGDVAQGKYFYTADGTKTAGTASGGGGGSLVIDDVPNTSGTTAEISVGGGGGGAQTQTGTFTGGDGNTAQISCDFEPDLIFVHGDLSVDPTLRGAVSLIIIKNTSIIFTADSSTSQATEYLSYVNYDVTGYVADTDNPYATYSNGTLTLNTVYNSGSARWASGITYSYKLVKWTA